MSIMSRDNKVLLVGGGAREAAIAASLVAGGARVVAAMHNENPGIIELCDGGVWLSHEESDVRFVAEWAASQSVDFAVIGVEDPLGHGIVDALAEAGIPAVGPNRRAAQLEMSKVFARDLMRKYDIAGQVEYYCFDDENELEIFLLSSEREWVLKPVGLTAGKGVKVMGEHLISPRDAVAYGKEVIRDGLGQANMVVVEERLVGEEFTLQCFVDGTHVLPMPAVQDHKRALSGDTGPNTGGMGSYSQEDGLLPFIKQSDYDSGVSIVRDVVSALRAKGIHYHGIIYGQFIVTKNGLRVIEFNARFGDPEAMNVLCLLKTNFVDICWAVINGTLDQQPVEFLKKATVCKYVVPHGYGTNPEVGTRLEIDRAAIEAQGGRVFFGKVNSSGSAVLTTTSRAIGIVGVGDSISEAELIVHAALAHVKGKYDVREDIGTKELIDRKVARMHDLLAVH